MSRINVLSKETAQLIAAGEVVERPSSVVKELIENSIDSGAAYITVEIKDGGISYIRITDNGCGMDSEDAEKAFLRHATSKIKSPSDLEAIYTLGFRGEALASIAAVAKVEVFTREDGALAGTYLLIEGSQIIEKKDIGCPKGTTITVKNLFYNTPARLKFLKKDRSEGALVQGVIEKIALSNPAVSIKFINEGKEQLYTPGDGKLNGAIYSVYGKQLADTLIQAEYEYNGIKVSGYISKPVFSRGNRKLQSFFINGRIAYSKILTASLEEGYRDSIMTGKYPVCVLNIFVNPHDIDVNVHPTKAEVKFSNDKLIFDSLYFAVKDALSKEDGRQVIEIKQNYDNKLKNAALGFYDSTAEQINLTQQLKTVENDSEKKSTEKQLIIDNKNINTYNNINIELPTDNFNQPMFSEGLIYKTGEPDFIPSFKIIENSIKTEEKSDEIQGEVNSFDNKKDFKILGEAFNTYIIIQTDDEICFIDKHAAHERMIYEKIKKGNNNARQQLLSPAVLQLQKDEIEVIKDNIKIIDDYGFTVEDFGAGSLLVREIPEMLSGENPNELLTSIASDLLESKGRIKTDAQDKILHTIACKAAIKAGRSNNINELYTLTDELLKMPDIKYCPHGRPIIFTLSKQSLEKQFKRTV